MRSFIEWSLKFKLLIVALALILIIIGLIQLGSISVDAFPEFAPPVIEIQTEAPGLSTPEVEELVTFNLEELLNGTPWLQSIRSTTVPGLSVLMLTFEPGTDILRARQLVSERLSLAYALPNVAQSPVILQPRSAMSRVMMIGLSSDKVNPIDMSVLAYWNIRPALLSVPGVANVAIWGLRYKELHVEADPKILQAKNIKLDQIISTTGNALWVSPLSFLNASTPGSGGWIDTPQQRIEVRHIMPISTPQDLAKINVEDSKLTLGDVTTVETGFPPLIGDAVINNGTAGLLILVDKFPGANTLDVSRKIEDKLSELQPGLSGISINKTIFEPANFVATVIGNMSLALGFGFLLLLLVFLLFTRSFRAVLICLITLLVPFALAITILNLLGASINMMVLAGFLLAIVIVIDDVAIDTEQLFLSRKDNQTKASMTDVLALTLKNRSSLFYATIIILFILVPIFSFSGIFSSFFRPLISTYAIVIILSALVAFIITPALSLLLLPKDISPEITTSPSFVERRYQKRYEWVINNVTKKVLTIFAIIVAVLTILGILIYLHVSNPPLFPALKEQEILVQWEGPPGTSIKEMVRISTRVNDELRKIKGVQNVAVDIGRAVLGDKIVNVNAAQIIIHIDPHANYSETLAVIQKTVNNYPGIFHIVQTYLKERTQQILTGTPYDIVVRIFGHDFADLRNIANQVKKIASQMKGTTDIHIDEEIDQPEIAVEVNLTKAQQYGLKPGDVRRAAATLIAGLQAGSLFDEQKIFPVVVWGTPDVRTSLGSMRDILIDTPSGTWVHLGDVADVSIKPSPNLIQHDTVSRSLDVGINVRGGNANAISNDLVQSIKKNITFPLESHTEVLSIYQQNLIAQEWLVLISIAVAIIIFLVLQAVFESFCLAALVFFSIPCSLIGGLMVAVLLHSTSSVALIGLLAVFGFALRNTILSITSYQLIHQQAPMNDQLLRQAAGARFNSIFFTTCAVIAFLLPLIILFNRPGLEIAGPMAAIIIGGMITSILYCGLIIPAIFLCFSESKTSSCADARGPISK